MTESSPPLRVFIPFACVSFYGMERTVIEAFDLLRPDVVPHFLLLGTVNERCPPLLPEIQRRGFEYSFFSDKTPWPRVQYPWSVKHFFSILATVCLGNRDVLKASISHDAIYIPSIFHVYYALVATILFRLRGKRVIYHVHDLILQKSLSLRLLNYCVTDYIHYSQTAFKLVAAANPFILKRRNHALPPRIEKRSPSAAPVNLKSEMQGCRNVLFVGQVSLHKGVDLLIDAAEILKRKHPRIRLHLVGGSTIVSPKLAEKIQASGIVRSWGFQEDTQPFFERAEFLVLPSPPSRFFESFGRVAIEANAAGVPVIAFRGGAMEEVIRDGETGLLCEEESARYLADAMDRFLSDEDFKRDCAANCRVFYDNLYSDDRVRSIWLDSLLPDHPRRQTRLLSSSAKHV